LAAIHGGPGAAGEMAPVAKRLVSELSSGVLEPLQTATTLGGQVEELEESLRTEGDPPLTLIGFSWGAWLSLIVAANFPGIAERLIIIGSGPFEESYLDELKRTRLNRLKEEEKGEFVSIVDKLQGSQAKEEDQLLRRLGQLTTKTDQYDPLSQPEKKEPLDLRGELFRQVWKEADQLRSSGELLKIVGQVRCPVVAIHGNYDPHPSMGVRQPLSAALEDFKFITLENCGHKPWLEREAREDFYRLLESEL